MRKAVAAALVATAVIAGCGGDDEEPTTTGAQETTEAQTTTEAAPEAGTTPEGIPTYEEAAKIALDGRSTPCKSRDDRDIGSYPDPEVYKRLFCSGVPQMDYVVGKQAVGENFDAARKQRSPIWGLEGQAYITGPPLDDDFAQRIKDSCDCGKVYPGTVK